ncbi:hypothetical protein ACI8AC_07585 [Geodermatophilus sp. SYSU D00758]
MTGSGEHRSSWRSAIHLAAWVLGVLYVPVSLIGAAVIGPGLLLLGVLGPGLLGAVLARSVHRALHPRTAAPLTHFMPAAVSSGLVVPFLAGSQQLGRLGAHLLLFVLGLAAVIGTVWAFRTETPPVRPTTGDEPPRPPVPPEESPEPCSPPHELLSALSLDDLLGEWRSSAQQMHPSSDVPRHIAVRWREALLDELRHRDPAGFDNWLFDGMRGSPEDHIRAGSDGATTERTEDPPR